MTSTSNKSVMNNKQRKDFNESKYYIDRELSWMDFNRRVLHQACRKSVPLIEQLKFLGITSSNLDEFIMVRFASVLNKIFDNKMEQEISGMYPDEEYIQLLEEIVQFKQMQDETFWTLEDKLEKQNIRIEKYKKLSKEEKVFVDKLFDKQIYPLLTPITFDTTNDFPLIRSKQLSIIVALEDTYKSNLNVISIIPIDVGLQRLYPINISNNKNEERYILLEEIIFHNLHKIFINKKVVYQGCMKILRQADIELDDNTDIYIVDRMKQTLLRREQSEPIFMDISSDVPKQVLKVLTNIFDINKHHVFKCKSVMDLSFLVSKPIRKESIEYTPFKSQYPEALIGEHDMFTAIDNGDILLHHPYESFSPVIEFLEHAADDPDVLAIRQTLYRVSSSESPIVNALCRAAQNGKQVNVLLEIKARFDEDRNMSLIEKLKLSGCKIIYGIEKLKTHCKFMMIVRRNKKKGMKLYCHIGTGNYNDKTAGIYTDISYFTSNQKIGEDLLAVFNILSGFSEPRDTINKIFYSPYNIRTKLYEMIDKETKAAVNGKKAYITLKLNSLSDKGIIQRLYHASKQGVKVTIICRGICSMKACNKNITIRSIVGRYLEHSRIYHFYNGGNQLLFISSADMLTRNLDRRVELMVPITNNECRSKLFNILENCLKDTYNSYTMDKDGYFSKRKSGDKSFNSHEFYMTESIEKYRLKSRPKTIFKVTKK